MKFVPSISRLAYFSIACALIAPANAAENNVKPSAEEPAFPPRLSGGKEVVTHTSEAFLKPTATLKADVKIAKTTPTIDFAFFPDQNYPGKPWSAWGDSLVVNGKYYASIGDHLAPGGNAFVYEYDPTTKKFRQLADVKKLLGLPEGHYTPGKIHGRLDMGDDGWIYFSTHRGSTRVTTDEFYYKGDWIIRCHPGTGKSEIVTQSPVAKHCIPCSVLDPKRLIFYGGTTEGKRTDGEGIQFFAYGIAGRKLLYSGEGGPARYMMFAKSTGRVYYTLSKEGAGRLFRYDPDQSGAPKEIESPIGLRAATQETADGMVYTVSNGQGSAESSLYSFNTKTEEVKNLGPAAVGTQSYITSLDADPTGRYLYYVPGAHGGSELDGSPVVQFDVKTSSKKVIAFLHPFFADKYGCTLKGTFSSDVDPAGDKVYVTWNNSRGSKAWDSCVLSVIHIPAAERSPE